MQANQPRAPRTRPRRSVLATALAATVGAIVLGIGAPAAYADTPCRDRTTTAAFSFAGDSNQYFAAANGSFDASTDWTLYGSRIVDGIGSPVNAARGTAVRSAFLPGSSSLVSSWTCVRGNEDSARFLVKPVGSAPGDLRLRLFVSDPSASSGWSFKTITLSAASPGTPYGNTGWYVTPRITIPWTPYWDSTQWVSFNFTSAASSGGWYVDDVMIDPWRTN